MDIQKLIEKIHQDILDWAENQPAWKGTITVTDPEMVAKLREEAGLIPIIDVETKKELPKDKRVVRTKTSGDRVYLIDEVAKTRAWLTSLEVLKDQGFEMDDVKEVDDMTMLKYNMAPAIYKTQ